MVLVEVDVDGDCKTNEYSCYQQLLNHQYRITQDSALRQSKYSERRELHGIVVEDHLAIFVIIMRTELTVVSATVSVANMRNYIVLILLPDITHKGYVDEYWGI